MLRLTRPNVRPKTMEPQTVSPSRGRLWKGGTTIMREREKWPVWARPVRGVVALLLLVIPSACAYWIDNTIHPSAVEHNTFCAQYIASGQLVEIDTPATLLQKSDSLLTLLVAELHPQAQERLREMAGAADRKQLGMLSWPSRRPK